MLAFISIASGPGQVWTVIGFWIGVVFAWAWIALMGILIFRLLGE